MNVIYTARQFAHDAHDSIGQKRKYTGEPYWVHVDDVANIVATVTNSPIVIDAAFLHDVVEDVNKGIYTLNYISGTFGMEVGRLVWELTDVYTPERYPNLNRAERKALEAWRLGQISPDAQTIKVADLLSNTASIVEHDPNFAKVYLLEKERVLSVLTKANPVLVARARFQLTEAKKHLNMVE